MRNLTMLTDFYEITMANGYLEQGIGEKIAYFDMFFRKVPDGGGYAILAGIEQLVEYLENLNFTEKDITYLRNREMFSEKFLEYLKNFKFSCDVFAIKEGTPIFPNEPIIRVKGPVIQAQFIETALLLTINHQSLIATKANRIVKSAQGRPVIEFGARRAQSYDGAILGARAAYIGGCVGTSCVIADINHGVKAGGTMAHSWVQMFDTEHEAFKAYAETYPDEATFLIDTYNVLKSGLPNAIKVSKEILEPMGKRLKAVRLDSGDIAYLSKQTREILDKNRYNDVKIMVSNSMDEFIIDDLLNQGAKIDSFGVGERLITSKSEPVFGGVYKLSAVVSDDGKIVPKIKISENVGKITNPHAKEVYRFFDKNSGKAIADVITLIDEEIDENKDYELFHPVHTWKKKTISNFKAVKLLEPLFIAGEKVCEKREISEIREFCLTEMNKLWEETTRLENPQTYYVDLSQELWNVKNELLTKYSK